MKLLPPDKQKELISHLKEIRAIAKGANYACQYNAGPARIALTAGVSDKVAKKVHTAYWEKNWAIKKVAEDQEVKTIRGQMWLKNPINGFYYSLRNDRDKFSTLIQGSGSYCFDLWLKYIRSKRPQLTYQAHDEFVIEIREGSRDRAITLINWAMDQVNNELKLNRELGCEIQFGKAYSHIH